MKYKILCILTTYNRPDKLLRFLGQFDSTFSSISDKFEIFIADDLPSSQLANDIYLTSAKSPIPIYYHRNAINLGQGPNLVNALKLNPDYYFYWCPGDDDVIIAEEFIECIHSTLRLRPAACALEFRQGRSMNSGTFFAGQSRLEFDINICLDLITRFGKGASTIISNPGRTFISFVDNELSNSMYQDKAIGIYSFLRKSKRGVYVHPKLTVYGDVDYGRLRYSMRVFSNLDLTVRKTISYYLSTSFFNLNITFRLKGHLSPLKWWWIGIKSHINPSCELSYTTPKFFKELFLGLPIIAYYALFKINSFQPK
jgi:hypothetical protein